MIKALLTILFFLLSNGTYACSCLPWPSDRNKAIKQSYKKYDDIVLAKAISINKMSKDDKLYYRTTSLKNETTHFKIITLLKGDIENSFTTTMVVGKGMCGVSFTEGETYLLYLYKPAPDSELYATSLCELNQSLDEAEEDIGILEKLEKH